MPRDPFARVKPGDVLPGIPAPFYNGVLDLLDEKGLGPKGGGGREDGPVEFRVKNTTGTAVDPFGLLQVNASLNDTTALNLFKFEDVLQGTTPAADKPFVVFQEPVKAGGVGRARILGVTTALVNVTDSSHNYAAPTTATDKLTSGTSGPARIIVKDSGTGDKWCKVLLLGQSQPAASAGPTWLAKVTGTGTINTGVGGGSGGTLTTSSAQTGLGLYWVYWTVDTLAQSTQANDGIEVDVTPALTGSTPSGVTLHGMGADLLGNTPVRMAGANGFVVGSIGLSAFVEVASPATGLPATQLTWGVSHNNGLGTVTGSVRADGHLFRLRTD